jgi:hypothetical protein
MTTADRGSWTSTVGSNRRAAFTLLELSVAGVLLVAVMALSVQVLGWVAAEKRAAMRRQWALEEAANVMDRVTALPLDRLLSQPEMEVTLSSQAQEVLPEGEVRVELIREPREVDARRVVVQVRWQLRPGQFAAPVRLTSWIYGHGSSSE